MVCHSVLARAPNLISKFIMLKLPSSLLHVQRLLPPQDAAIRKLGSQGRQDPECHPHPSCRMQPGIRMKHRFRQYMDVYLIETLLKSAMYEAIHSIS